MENRFLNVCSRLVKKNIQLNYYQSNLKDYNFISPNMRRYAYVYQ